MFKKSNLQGQNRNLIGLEYSFESDRGVHALSLLLNLVGLTSVQGSALES